MKNVLILVVTGIQMGCLEQVGGFFPTYSFKRNARLLVPFKGNVLQMCFASLGK